MPIDGSRQRGQDRRRHAHDRQGDDPGLLRLGRPGRCRSIPSLSGVPAAGFEIASVTVNPEIVLIEGDADQLAQLVSIDTSPIPMTGVSANTTVQASLALPTGIVAVGSDTIQVVDQAPPGDGDADLQRRASSGRHAARPAPTTSRPTGSS